MRQQIFSQAKLPSASGQGRCAIGRRPARRPAADHRRRRRRAPADPARSPRRRPAAPGRPGAHARLAESQPASDPAGAAKLIAQAREEAQLAIRELRELASGIHPAVLSDRGLGMALQSLATRAPVPVHISALPSVRLPPAVEAGAYFVTAEALTNVAKYARASEAFVELSLERNCLGVEVRDDGVGGADPAMGTGLEGLRDRVNALDGSLELWLARGRGHDRQGRDPAGALAATERIGGRWVAASNQVSPASPDP